MRAVTWVGRNLWITLLALVVGLASPTLARDLPWERESLAGLGGVNVLIEVNDSDLEREGLARSTLQTDVEVKLRQAGIRVLTEIEWLAAPGSPILSVAVDALRLETGSVALLARLTLFQEVALRRNPVIALRAATWQKAVIIAGTGTVDKVREMLREQLRDKVDEFINAYLAANPKR